MRWLFERKSESTKRVIYRYSRDSDSLDGLVVYDKRMEEAFIYEPCREDLEGYPNRRETLSHFINYVVERSFPERKKVVFVYR